MSTFDAFKQYQSEQARIRQKIRDEENPFHAAHIQEFNEMMDEKIRTQVPMLIQQYNERQKVNVDAYFNGKPATDANIIKGVRDMVANALKKIGKGRYRSAQGQGRSESVCVVQDPYSRRRGAGRLGGCEGQRRKSCLG